MMTGFFLWTATIGAGAMMILPSENRAKWSSYSQATGTTAQKTEI
ncbi:hypothetical protein [Desulfofustis limnaeus]|nr:hypothetical protein [Desulfofustis limnaeus]